MKEKIVSLLFVCLVVMSIICVLSNTALSSSTTKSTDAMPSRPITPTEEIRQKGRPSYPGPPLCIMGDPVLDAKPH